DPAYVQALRARAAEKDAPAIVVGSRFALTRRYDAPLGRRLGMLLFSRLTGIAGGRRIYDTTSGFQWLSRAAMTPVTDPPAGRLQSEIIIYSLLRGLSVVETPIVMQERRQGASMYGSLAAIVYPLKTLLAIAVLLVQAQREGRRA